jgi:hypothetical protein
VIRAAKAGELKGAALKKAIKRADELGMRSVVRELQLYLVSSEAFAGDDAPAEVRERVAQGVSALTAMGHTLSRTRQMFKKHGVIETLNRIARYPASTQNFERLTSAGLQHLTAEAIVLDFPGLFSEQAIEVARQRLSRT